MKIDVICVGKMKEAFWRDAVDEYSKRMSRFVTLNIFEVKDENTPDNASEKEIDIILEKEAARLEKYISDNAYICALCVEGEQLSSEGFSEKIEKLENAGFSHIQFVIGGSLGLHYRIKQRAKFRISFSKMTFPHMLMRVILMEQIYRAYKIKSNEPYHK